MDGIIKITKEHYVIVDDSEIKIGDYFLYHFGDCPEICQHDEFGDPNQRKNCYKIIYSSQPIKTI